MESKTSSSAHFLLLAPLPLLIVCTRTFNFEEKKEVDKYYPQYYHKMDKVPLDPSPLLRH